MRGRTFIGGGLLGGTVVIASLGGAPHVADSDPEALLDGIEAVAVTPSERREEMEARLDEASTSASDETPSLRDDLPEPDAVETSGTTSVDVDPVDSEPGASEGAPAPADGSADPATGAEPEPEPEPEPEDAGSALPQGADAPQGGAEETVTDATASGPPVGPDSAAAELDSSVDHEAAEEAAPEAGGEQHLDAAAPEPSTPSEASADAGPDADIDDPEPEW
jgi:hypothetical protein